MPVRLGLGGSGSRDYTSQLLKPPMWRNGRRNGLKITILAISAPLRIDQIEVNFPGNSRNPADFQRLPKGEQQQTHSCTNSCTRARRIVVERRLGTFADLGRTLWV